MTTVRTILMIDDDSDDKILFHEALREVDPSIIYRTAANGEEGLNCLLAAGNDLPDLIFLDLNMPRMNGKVFLLDLKQIEHLCRIPVCIYTTSKLASDVTETQQLGAANFFTKPDSYEDIRQIIIDLLASEAVPQSHQP